VQIDITEKLMQ